LLPYLFLKRNYFWKKTDKVNLPGKIFFEFGKSIGNKLFQKGIVSPKLLLNPVSIVRYFEFDFTLNGVIKTNSANNKILDISSPYLFGYYIASKYEGEYKYVNPDKNDLALVKKYSSKLKFGMNYSTEATDATNLSFSDNSFSHIISISVIEHINGSGDGDAIKEMWRVLKPNGLLILTFPVAKSFIEEFSDNNIYGLSVDQKKEKFFFQRVYDEVSINERLLDKIKDFTILSMEIFGESEPGFYRSYTKRWEKEGLRETVKDPYYISKYFKKIKCFDEIKDSAVIGITVRKDK
jgi:ubiquinone/menaquinone biosynthesis C-methylase UbiE